MRSERDPIRAQDVSAAFQALASEHAKKRELAEREPTWMRIRHRLYMGSHVDLRDGWSRWLPRVLVPVALSAAAAVALFFAFPDKLEYKVREASVSGDWIRSRAERSAVDFSDGSQVQMHLGTELAVDVVGAHAARAHVARGDLDISVKHRKDTDYRFIAGPYEVRVIGTRFHLAWQPETGSFSLAMREGRVRVTGPNGLDRPLSAGETLRIAGPELVAARVIPPSATPEPVAAPAPEAANASGRLRARAPAERIASLSHFDVAPSRARDSARSGAESVSESSDARGNAAPVHSDANAAWSALVAKGKFSDVVALAEEYGTERTLRERSSAELSALAHAAHYTGHSALAVSAWTTLRDRFAGQRSARQAAFFLGRVFDQQGRSTEALRWLNTYLSEAPGDVYVSEALGRKLTLLQKLEGTSAAQAVARDYVRRFPEGAYAQAAHAMLSDGGPSSH